MLSKIANFIAMDTETGGLPNKSKKAFYDIALTEVAMVAISDDLEIIDQKSWLIKPYKDDLEYNPQAAEVSGITKQICIDSGQDIKVVVKEMISFMKKHKPGTRLPVILGHNFVSFDIPFLVNAFEFCGEDLTKWCNDEPEDTLKWARLCWKEQNNYKLGTCCESAGINLVEAHRALPDTISTAKLWIHFMKNLRGLNSIITINQKEEKRFRQTFEL